MEWKHHGYALFWRAGKAGKCGSARRIRELRARSVRVIRVASLRDSLSAGSHRLPLFRLRFRKRNNPGLIHLAHGIGEFRRVLRSGEAAEEITKEDQGADKGDECYDEKHSERASRGTRNSMFLMLVLPQWEDLLIR